MIWTDWIPGRTSCEPNPTPKPRASRRPWVRGTVAALAMSTVFATAAAAQFKKNPTFNPDDLKIEVTTKLEVVPLKVGPADLKVQPVAISHVPLDEQGRPVCSPLDEALTGALVDEDGHYIGTVLEPDAYPFTVEAVRYVLRDDAAANFSPNALNQIAQLPGAECDSNLPHRVFGFVVGSDGLIPDIPQLVFEKEVDPGAVRIDRKQVTVDIDPVVLEDGQKLVVAVEMISPFIDGGTCMTMCRRVGGGLNTEYTLWSYATEAPFNWQVAPFGYEAMVAMIGH